MRLTLLVIALLALGGCSNRECKCGGNDPLELQCEYLVACTDTYEDVDTCISETEPATYPGDCVYDPEKAEECMEAWEEAGDVIDCDSFEIPASCEEVVHCPEQGDSGV
jgi:hypothetical protein